jgi:tetratricopeptide (TPR) repeat protein
LDWKSSYTIAAKDYSVSHDNYVADKNIALYYFSQGDYTKSRDYAQQSVSLFPNVLGYNTLGMALSALNDYPASAQAFTAGMKYQDYVSLYENRAALTATYGTPAANIQFLVEAVNNFPKDSQIWFYLAIQEYRDSNISNAKLAITQAYKYAPSNQTVEIIDSRIMNNQPLNISFSTK